MGPGRRKKTAQNQSNSQFTSKGATLPSTTLSSHSSDLVDSNNLTINNQGQFIFLIYT